MDTDKKGKTSKEINLEELDKQMSDMSKQLGTLASKVYAFEETIERIWEQLDSINQELNSGNFDGLIDYTPILVRLVDQVAKISATTENLTSFRPLAEKQQEMKMIDYDVGLDRIDWQLPKGQGPASDNSQFAWAFIFKYGTNEVKPETKKLYEIVKEYGKLNVDKYEITLGGDSGSLLQRRIKQK